MCRKILPPTAAQFESAHAFSAIAETTRHATTATLARPTKANQENEAGTILTAAHNSDALSHYTSSFWRISRLSIIIHGTIPSRKKNAAPT